ncbi:hypothetical protein IE4872_CH00999 [Rhizobium gallicum]|uniref:Uncharacterized protein n=1 Tax=Rhizobium gallicum TaxID=56730 RepID=A0A1L5NFH3_9HYPH|nr:hypothetical protein IE4872_CH00999 [Rhizobium gallicum]
MPPVHLERTAQWRLLCARERTRNTAKPSSRLDAVILELVGHLDEVAVRILEVNGQDFTIAPARSPGPSTISMPWRLICRMTESSGL